MKSTAFIYHPDYRHHETGLWHPENSGRLDTVLADLENDSLVQSLSWYRPDPALLVSEYDGPYRDEPVLPAADKG